MEIKRCCEGVVPNFTDITKIDDIFRTVMKNKISERSFHYTYENEEYEASMTDSKITITCPTNINKPQLSLSDKSSTVKQMRHITSYVSNRFKTSNVHMQFIHDLSNENVSLVFTESSASENKKFTIEFVPVTTNE